MDLPEALSGISAYSSIQNLPLVGIKGLRLYLRESKTKDQIQRMVSDLSIFRDRFCKVLTSIQRESSEAMLANISVYKGIQQIYGEKPEELRKLSEEFAALTSLIDKILQSQPVKKEAIEPYFTRLEELSQKASKSFRHAEPEEFFLGQPPTT